MASKKEELSTREVEAGNTGDPRAIRFIAGGSSNQLASKRQRKSYARQIHHVAASSSPAPPEWSDVDITFLADDAEGIEFPHQDALVISAIIADFEVKRVLVDGGSSAVILFTEAFDQMLIPRRRLTPAVTSQLGLGQKRVNKAKKPVSAPECILDDEVARSERVNANMKSYFPKTPPPPSPPPLTKNVKKWLEIQLKPWPLISDFERTMLNKQVREEAIKEYEADKGKSVKQLCAELGKKSQSQIEALPYADVHVIWEFKLGEPMVCKLQEKKLTTKTRMLHEFYLKEYEDTKRECLGCQYKEGDFHEGDGVIWVDYKEINQLYHWDKIDISMIQLWYP